MSPPVLVIGATGKTGAPLTRRLTEKGAAVRSATRSGTAVDGSQGVVFDWYDPSTHARALDGVKQIYIVAPVGHNAPVDIVAPFIDLALAQGARRFVLLSSSLLEEGGPAMGQIHAYLRQHASEWAVLRPSWFMQNFVTDPHLASIRSQDAIYSATGDGRVPFIAVEDIAAVAAEALLGDAPPHDLLLTGPRAIDYAEVARIIGDARGKPVRHIRLSVDDLAARHEAFGLAADYAAMLAGLDGLIETGAEDRTVSTISEIAGSDPMTFEEFAIRNVQKWQ